MAAPTTDGSARSQRRRAKRPDEEEIHNPDGPNYLARVRPTPDQVLTSAEVKAEGPASIRRRLLTQQALLMLADGEELIDIAAALSVAPGTVTGWIARHRQSLRKGTIDLRLDQIAVPLATDNLIHGLIAGDKDYTLETLKGRGHLRRHAADQSTVVHEIPPLVIRFEKPVHDMDPSTASNIGGGRIVGAAALPGATRGPEPIDLVKGEDGAHEMVGVGRVIEVNEGEQ